MSVVEQIEEMVKVMNECCNRYDEQGNHLGNKCYECEEWSYDNHCCCSYNMKEATALYNNGYRKASEVAREIFEEIETSLSIADFKGSEVYYVIRAEDYLHYKKKYTESKDTK